MHTVLVNNLQKANRKIQRKTGDWQYIYQNKLGKACIQHGMDYGDFKDLTRRTASAEILHDKAYTIAQNLKYAVYQRGLAWMVYNFLIKKTCDGAIKNEKMPNKVLAEELPDQLLEI